jgi:UDP:flavonoid glycosyltransferase YjiC (YdhE family)
MSPPGLDYVRGDLPSHVKYIGLLPREPLASGIVYPAWWNVVTSGERQIVVVTQGSLAVNYEDLLLLTIRCLADRDDLLVVGILGVKGAVLPPSSDPLLSDTRIVDYLSYDALLPHVAVSVNNDGYGGVI